jgi:hypothetical protein
VRVTHVIAAPVEGVEERVRGHVVREARPEPARHVPVDLRVVTVEDLREPLRLTPRPLDEGGV